MYIDYHSVIHLQHDIKSSPKSKNEPAIQYVIGLFSDCGLNMIFLFIQEILPLSVVLSNEAVRL